MDVNEIAAIAYLHLKRRKVKKRRFWIHPILSEKRKTSLFYNLYPQLKEDPEKFFNYLRMSITSFNELLNILKGSLTNCDTRMRTAITPEEKLVITLRYLATGCTFMELHFSFAVGRSTICYIIREVCQAIWTCMKDSTIPEPEEENWLKISETFESRANFPHCIGALDGKHIRVIQPKESGSLYFNYKKYFSFVLLAVCDADYCFTYVDIGSYGKSSDSNIFKQSPFHKKMVENNLKIPAAKCLTRSVDTTLPFVFVGDEAFGLSENVLRPYGGKFLSTQKKVFNYRLSRARRYIECSFGILANKWRILHRPLNVEIDLAIDIVKSCCILHNFVRKRDGYNFDDSITVPPELQNFNQDNTSRGNYRALELRDKFMNYFVSREGELSWQYDMI